MTAPETTASPCSSKGHHLGYESLHIHPKPYEACFRDAQRNGTTEDAALILVLFKGHPGVGKSTLARAVCQQLGWPLIDKDDARDCLQQAGLDIPQAAAAAVDANQLSYDIMFAYCRTQLQLGLSTVMDCPLARPTLYDTACKLAAEHGAEVVVVECIASDTAAWRQQLEARGAAQQHSSQAHKPQTWDELQQLIQRYDKCHQWTTDGSRDVKHHCIIDMTSGTHTQRVERVVGLLQTVRHTN